MVISFSGDSGYPLEPFLMIPFGDPVTPGQQRYNRSHKKTRVIIEQTFGVLKSRFRCLHHSGGSLQYEPKKCAKIAAACMWLHNKCVQRRIPEPVLDEGEGDNVGDGEVDDNVMDEQNASGAELRQEIVDHFFS